MGVADDIYEGKENLGAPLESCHNMDGITAIGK
jgi:hypothetical protein